MPEEYKQKKVDWILVFVLTVLYQVVCISYYTSFPRVLDQAGWAKSLSLLTSASSAGYAVGSLILFFVVKKWNLPHYYLTIGSSWWLFSCMLGLGFLLIFQTPPLWLLIVLRFLEGASLTILFNSSLHLFHWGVWYKVKAWEFEDKQQVELAVGKEQARRSNLLLILGFLCGLLSFWQLGKTSSSHPVWFLTVLIGMFLFAILTLGTIRFPNKLAFPESPNAHASMQSTISLRNLFISLIGVIVPSTIFYKAVETYLPGYSGIILIPLITMWETLAGLIGTKLCSKINPCWNSVIIQTAYVLFGIGMVLMWSSKNPVVLGLALFTTGLGDVALSGVLYRTLLVQLQLPESQKMLGRVVLILSRHTSQIFILLFGIVANYFGIRWMWLSLLLTIPVGFVSLKRMSLLKPSAKDLRKRHYSLIGPLVGITLFLAKKRC